MLMRCCGCPAQEEEAEQMLAPEDMCIEEERLRHEREKADQEAAAEVRPVQGPCIADWQPWPLPAAQRPAC